MTQTKKTSSEPYISSQIARQLDKAIDQVHNGDQDRVYIISGREGLGKSTLAMQLAHYCDPSFSNNCIVFNSESFEKKIREVPQFKAVVFDECFNGLSSKGSLSKENKKLLRLLQECRQRNLFIFLVLPSFFILEKYAALFRSHALFNVLRKKKNYKQRYYKAYNYQMKKRLYILGKPLMDYSKPYIAKNHNFFKKLPSTVDEAAYRKAKLEAFRDIGSDSVEVANRTIIQRSVISCEAQKLGYSFTQQSKDCFKANEPVDASSLAKLAKAYGRIGFSA